MLSLAADENFNMHIINGVLPDAGPEKAEIVDYH